MSVLLVPVAACGFSTRIGDGLDAPPGTIVRRLDTVAELAGGTHDATFVHASGTVEPVAYAYGGLLARGINARLFDHPSMGPNAGTWELLAGATVAGRGFITPLDFNFSSTTFPRQLGVTRANDYCVFMDGEIWLEAGMHRFEVDCDHDAFVDVARPGMAFARVVNSRFEMPNPDIGMFTANADGWHGIRVAYCQDTGNSGVSIRHGALGAGPTNLQPRRLRALVGDLAGDDQIGLDERYLGRLEPNARRVDGTTAFDESWSTGTPPLVGSAAQGSLRLAGQLRVPADATLEIAVQAMNEHRLWLDGELVSAPGAWMTGNQSPTSTTVTRPLATGWHDLAVDVSPASGDTGAITALVGGAAIPLDRVRPVAGRQRIVGFDRSGSNVSSSGGTVSFPIVVATSIPNEPAAIATEVDVTWAMSVDDWQAVEVSLVPPGGAPIVLFADPASGRSGTFTDFAWVRATDLAANQPVDGSWALAIRDTSGDGISGNLLFFAPTIHYRGGPPTYPRGATYVSPVIALGANARLVKAHLSALAIPDTTTAISARACSDAGGATCGPWISAADLEAGMGERGEYAQLRLELGGTGDAAAIVDWIELWASDR